MKQSEYVYIIDEDNEKKHEKGSVLCYRDKEKFNRFIFEWPPEWRTSSVRERVIGFRSLWISKEYRHLKFMINIDYEEDSSSIEVNSWLNDEHDLRKLWYDIRNCIQKFIDIQTKAGFKIPFTVDDFSMDFDYKNGTFNNYLKFYDADAKLDIYPVNDDARAVLNISGHVPSDDSNIVRFENIWNGKACCLKSSFSISNGNSYLGYSNKSYEPIKYYRINCSEPYFYIDLFHSNNSNVPVNLPRDNKDGIVLGIVVVEEK